MATAVSSLYPGGVGGPWRPPGDRRLRRDRARAPSSARRCTSSPRTTCARGRASSARRWAAHEVVFASKAFPCTAVLRVFARGGPGGRRRLGRRARAGAAARASAARGSSCTATRSPRPSCAAAAEVGARIVVDNFDELDRLDAARRARRGDVRVTPGVVADTHAAILTGHAGSKFGFASRDAPARSSGCGRALGGPARAPHPHRLAAVRPRAVAGRGGGDRDAGRLPRLRPRRRARRRLHAGPAAADASPSTSSTMIATARRAARARQAALARARPRARRHRRRDALHGRVGQGRRAGGRAGALRGRRRRDVATTCARCSTTRRYEADLADRVGAPARPAPSWASTASRATC